LRRAEVMKKITAALTATAAATAAVCALFSFIIVNSAGTEIQTTYTNTMMEMAPSYADTISLWNSTIAGKMLMYSEADIVRTGNTQDIVTWLRKNSSRRPVGIAYILYVDRDGNAWSDEGKTTNVADRAYYRAVIKGSADTYIDSPVISRLNGKNVYHICAAAYDENGSKKGMFAGDVLLDTLQEFVESDMTGSSGFISVMDGEGKCIINHDPRFRMQDMTHDPEPGADRVVTDMLERRTGSGTIQTEYLGTAKAFFAPIKGCSWEFMFLVPEIQIKKPVERLLVTSVIFSILLIMIEMTLISIFIWKPSEK
jgi:methyl-accepting chemotaxis protein